MLMSERIIPAIGEPPTPSSFDSVFPLGLALGSPIFPSGCQGKLGVALVSLQAEETSPRHVSGTSYSSPGKAGISVTFTFHFQLMVPPQLASALGQCSSHPEVPAFPGEEYEVPDTCLGEVSSALQ